MLKQFHVVVSNVCGYRFRPLSFYRENAVLQVI
jgi:hypothetical protein